MKLSKKIAEYKIYFDRGRIYISYIQFILLLKIAFSDFIKGYMYFIALPGALLFMFGIGYLDTRFGIRKRELENNASQNPVLTEILKRIDELK